MRLDDVRVRNKSAYQQCVVDAQIPAGRVFLNPGEETVLPKVVYRRVCMRCSTWMVNADTEAQRHQAEVAQEPPVLVDPDTSPEEWTHLYMGIRARIAAEDGPRVTVALDGEKSRSMLRATWLERATAMAEGLNTVAAP